MIDVSIDTYSAAGSRRKCSECTGCSTLTLIQSRSGEHNMRSMDGNSGQPNFPWFVEKLVRPRNGQGPNGHVKSSKQVGRYRFARSLLYPDRRIPAAKVSFFTVQMSSRVQLPTCKYPDPVSRAFPTSYWKRHKSRVSPFVPSIRVLRSTSVPDSTNACTFTESSYRVGRVTRARTLPASVHEIVENYWKSVSQAARRYLRGNKFPRPSSKVRASRDPSIPWPIDRVPSLIPLGRFVTPKTFPVFFPSDYFSKSSRFHTIWPDNGIN